MALFDLQRRKRKTWRTERDREEGTREGNTQRMERESKTEVGSEKGREKGGTLGEGDIENNFPTTDSEKWLFHALCSHFASAVDALAIKDRSFKHVAEFLARAEIIGPNKVHHAPVLHQVVL